LREVGETTGVSPLEQRAIDLANAFAEDAVRGLREQHPALDDDSESGQIEQGVRQRAREQFLATFIPERAAGLRNDLQSSAPGLKSIVTEEALNRFRQTSIQDYTGGKRPSERPVDRAKLDDMIEEWARQEGTPPPPRGPNESIDGHNLSDSDWASLQHRRNMPPFFTQIQTADGQILYEMSLPVGAYRQQGDRLVFTASAVFQDGEMFNSEAWFSFPAAEVREIIGSQGDYWRQAQPQPAEAKA
jgi:hypothetical protein